MDGVLWETNPFVSHASRCVWAPLVTGGSLDSRVDPTRYDICVVGCDPTRVDECPAPGEPRKEVPDTRTVLVGLGASLHSFYIWGPVSWGTVRKPYPVRRATRAHDPPTAASARMRRAMIGSRIAMTAE